MINKRFENAKQQKNTLAHELYDELLLKRANLPNNFSEKAYDFYWFYHDAIYNSESEYYFFAPYDAPLSEFKADEDRLHEFRTDKDYQEFIAVEVYLAIDNGEFGGE